MTENCMIKLKGIRTKRQGLISILFLVTLGSVGMVFISSCAGSKKIAAPVERPREGRSPEEYLAQKIVYTSFAGKAQTHFESKDQNQDFTTNLKMKKDQQVWASIVALGIAEVARASITPDSLRAVIRIGKKAYALSYEEGLKLIQAQVDFPVLQNLFIGNPLIDKGPIQNSQIKDSLLHITMVNEDFKQELIYHTGTGLLERLNLTSAKRDFACNIIYGKYGAVNYKQPFAFSRTMVIDNAGEQVKLNLEFSKAELDVPVDLPFEIPASYTRMKPGE